MNLKIKNGDFEIELLYAEPNFLKKVLLASMAHIGGGSFRETFDALEVDSGEPVRSFSKSYITAVDGIRERKDGRKTYKCAYLCQCGNKGSRYIEKDAAETSCHKCATVLTVFKSNDDGSHDEDFNYFVAY